ncbi:MAG: hypothetical protein V2G42_05335 [bacterium JZ-2024 1]
MIHLQPMDVLEIVNAGTTIFRRNFVPLFGLSLLAFLPNIPLQVASAHLANQAQASNDLFAGFGHFLLTGVVGFIIGLTWSSLLLIAVYRVIADYLTGKPVDLAEAIAHAFGNFFPILLTKILIGVLLVVFFVGGLFVIGIFLVLWGLIGWALVNPVIAAEGIYYFHAMRRSWKLMFGYRSPPGSAPTYLRYLFLYILYVLIGAVLGFLAYLPQILFTMKGLFQGNSAGVAEVPFGLMLTTAVLQNLVSSVLLGFMACAVFVFYTDLRTRFEAPPEPAPQEVPAEP